MSAKSNKLDRVFLRRFTSCLKIMFPSLAATTTLLFVLLLGLSFMQQALIYNTGLLPSQLIETLVDRDKQRFRYVVFVAIVIIFLVAVGKSLLAYVSGILYVFWRRNLTKHIQKFYFADDTFYALNVLQQGIDNLDQRITQDVDKLSSQFSTIFSTLIISPFTVAYYTYQCYKSTGYIGPVSIYGYFVFGTLVNKLIMAPIVKLVFRQEKLEGDFRFKHMQLRVNSESAAFYHSGQLEEKKTTQKLDNLLSVQLTLVNYQFMLQLLKKRNFAHDFSDSVDHSKLPSAINLFDYFGSIVSYLVVSIPLFKGSFDELTAGDLAGVVSRYSFVSMYLIYSFSQLIDLSNQISDIAGFTHRIGEILEFFNNRVEPERKTLSYDRSLDSDMLAVVENLTYYAPMSLEKPLVNGLNLKIHNGKNLLITGKTGSGKSSFLRILCGLWQAEFGNVFMRDPSNGYDVLFLPQKPLLTDGSLKQQIVYPEDASSSSSLGDLFDDSERNKKVDECLVLVKLEEVCKRAGGLEEIVDWNWEDVLSPGEMQRLSFARLFYHQPECAFLDEASSALDVETENLFYQTCRSFGMTLITVGHRESLKQYHDYQLVLDGKGGWILQDLHSA